MFIVATDWRLRFLVNHSWCMRNKSLVGGCCGSPKLVLCAESGTQNTVVCVLCPVGVNRYVITGRGGGCHCQLRSHGSDLWVSFISFPLVVGSQLSRWSSASLGRHVRHGLERLLGC